ncbi:hypothetical protein IUS38_24390 [Mycobacteroides abscessus subsp. abscessus]|uniref:hypothetical protein n=1 Tax=Mycobacteroides abscessus TaxID=36809 RepID=UPI0019D02F0B|nr:hypothetical protein [Mycobacteroides abscessus]MBN7438729.1 hypothetical protein [Mycobacteroides abscessus subsp. abscessus]
MALPDGTAQHTADDFANLSPRIADHALNRLAKQITEVQDRMCQLAEHLLTQHIDATNRLRTLERVISQSN